MEYLKKIKELKSQAKEIHIRTWKQAERNLRRRHRSEIEIQWRKNNHQRRILYRLYKINKVYIFNCIERTIDDTLAHTLSNQQFFDKFISIKDVYIGDKNIFDFKSLEETK